MRPAEAADRGWEFAPGQSLATLLGPSGPGAEYAPCGAGEGGHYRCVADGADRNRDKS